MKDKSTMITVLVAVALVVATLITVVYISKKNSDPEKGAYLIPFAQCIKDSGAKFYGAYWCPHCREQKVEFGKAAAFLPYVECANTSGNGQTQACIDKDIKLYPTWIFANGEKVEGKLSLETLAEKTSCTLPEDTGVSPVQNATSTSSDADGGTSAAR